MFTRTKTRVIHFNRPFVLTGVEGVQSPGDYQVQDDEEQITGISWLAYRRVATTIEIPAGPKTSLVPIDAVELDAAIERDKAPTPQTPSLTAPAAH
ncbi:hypothetical protein ACSV9I_05550 [Rhizobium sp. G187]|uniref:hypothetical protein n=1 Tax=unclassified Rhizobium TaxID=2613769 RepID=UPI0006BA08B2|nr:hypothetical protein [Rhizobium sp. AAP43]KPF42753.1 hypothetical protein IP76_16345 [Rhizobium sp. AAP43]